jgi:hypothetical protein
MPPIFRQILKVQSVLLIKEVSLDASLLSKMISLIILLKATLLPKFSIPMFQKKGKFASTLSKKIGTLLLGLSTTFYK